MPDFAVGESAQVDFAQGPVITDRHTGEVIKTWVFVMTLALSRHQYAEIVRNQKGETWRACHRHAFEWLNGCPLSIRIDYVPRNKIVAQDPKHSIEVQEREFMRLQKRLLRGARITVVESAAARHAAHREHLHLLQLTP